MLNSEEELILLSMAISPPDEWSLRFDSLLADVKNWEQFTDTLSSTGIAPLFYVRISNSSNVNLIPKSCRNILKQSYYYVLSRSLLIQHAFAGIAALAEKEGLQIIVLKGICLADELYHNPALRLMSDMDLLLPEADAYRLQHLLIQAGYSTEDSTDFIDSNRELVHLNPLVKDGIAVEIHLKLHRSIEKYSQPVSAVFSRLMPVEIQKHLVWMPDRTDHLIFIALHLDRHFRQGGIQLSGYSDLINLSLNLSEGQWQVVEERCEEYNCCVPFFTHMVLLNKAIALPLPVSLLDKYFSLADNNTIVLFRNYLQGRGFDQSGVANHLSSMKQLSGWTKIRYFLAILFPSRKFMMQKYSISSAHFFWFWYPLRWFIGLKKWVRQIRN